MKRVNLKLINIIEVAEKLGLVRGGNGNYHCPLHKDNNPSMSIRENKGFRCFSCGTYGNIVDLVKMILKVSTEEAFNWLADEFPNAKTEDTNQSKNYFLRMIGSDKKFRFLFKDIKENELLDATEIDIENIKKYLNKNYKLSTLSELGIKICSKPYSLVFPAEKFLIYISNNFKNTKNVNNVKNTNNVNNVKNVKNTNNVKNTMNVNNVNDVIVFEGRTDYLSAVDSGLGNDFVIASTFNKTAKFNLPNADNYYLVLDADDDSETLQTRILNYGEVRDRIKFVKCPNDYKDFSDYYNSSDFDLELFKDYLINNSESLYQEVFSHITWEKFSDSFTEIEWYWEGWIPKGFVTFIAGESGSGKSFFTLYLVKIFTEGGYFFDGGEFNEKLSSIVWIENENSENLNFSRALDIELSLGKIIDPRKSVEEDFNLADLDNQEKLKKLAKHVNLVVLDSLSGNYTSDENSTQFAESVKFLAELAKINNIAVIIIHHLRKASINSKSLTIERLRGSSKIVQFARSVIGLERTKGNTLKVSSLKNNLGQKPEPIYLTFNQGRIELNEDEKCYESTKVDEAEKFLLDALIKPMKSSMLKELATQKNISVTTLNRAKRNLRVKCEKDYEDGKAHWMTRLPDDENGLFEADKNIRVRPP